VRGSHGVSMRWLRGVEFVWRKTIPRLNSSEMSETSYNAEEDETCSAL